MKYQDYQTQSECMYEVKVKLEILRYLQGKPEKSWITLPELKANLNGNLTKSYVFDKAVRNLGMEEGIYWESLCIGLEVVNTKVLARKIKFLEDLLVK